MSDVCPICRDGGPAGVIAELPATWVSAPSRAPLPGYVCVVARRHVTEPFQLPPGDMQAFWRECMLVARAVTAELAPRKMNYEIHGNTIAHLHMHLYPRFDGDPYEGQAIDGHATFARTADQLGRIAEAVNRAAETP